MERMRIKPYFLLILFIWWGLFLSIQTYILVPAIINNLFSWIGRLFLLILLFLISIALGEVILKRFKIYSLTLFEKRVFEAGFGLSSLAFIIFFLGIFRLYYFFTGFILIGILFLLLWPGIKNILSARYPLSPSRFDRLLFLFMALNLVIILMGVLIPPLDYDVLEYHLGVPDQYIKAHRIIYLPYNMYSNFPLHMEMLYTLGLLLEGPILSTMIHFLFFILTLCAIAIIGNKILPRAGLLASLIFMNIPIVSITAAKTYNDFGLALFGLLSIYSLWLWQEQKDKKFISLAGIFAGSAVAAKYTGVIFFLVPLAIFILIASLRQAQDSVLRERKGIKYVLSGPAVFVIISLLVASPWLLKNMLYTGNPVFPIAYEQLGGRNWGAIEAGRFKKHHYADLTDFKTVIAPLKKILTGREQMIGITVILFIPFLFFIRNLPSQVKCLGIYTIFYFLLWTLFTHRMPRFLIPCLAFLSILAGFLIFYFLNSKKYIGNIMLAFLLIGITSNTITLFYQFSLLHPLQFICGKDSKAEYLSKIFYLYPAIDFINTCLPPGSRILFIAEARTFYCEKEFVVNTPLDKNIIVEIANRSEKPKDILGELRNMGITHVLYNVTEARRITQSYQSFNWQNPKAQENYLDFMVKYIKIIFSHEGVVVGELPCN